MRKNKAKIIILCLIFIASIIIATCSFLYVKYGRYFLNPYLKSEIANLILDYTEEEKENYQIIFASHLGDIATIMLKDISTGMWFGIQKALLPFDTEGEEIFSIDDLKELLKEFKESENLSIQELSKETMMIRNLEISFVKGIAEDDEGRTSVAATTFTFEENGQCFKLLLMALNFKEKYRENVKEIISKILSRKGDILTPYRSGQFIMGDIRDG